MKEKIFLFPDNCGINKIEKRLKLAFVTASGSMEAPHISLMSDSFHNGTPEHQKKPAFFFSFNLEVGFLLFR